VFCGTAGLTGASFDESQSDPPATFEFVLDTDTETGLLFETGGTVAGMFFEVNGGELRGTVLKNDVTSVGTPLTAEERDGFIHVVFEIDSEQEFFRVFVDGALRNSTPWSRNDWSGSDGAGLGIMNTGMAGSNPGPFIGSIAIMRYYSGTILTPEEVRANFDALTLPVVPGIMLIVK